MVVTLEHSRTPTHPAAGLPEAFGNLSALTEGPSQGGVNGQQLDGRPQAWRLRWLRSFAAHDSPARWGHAGVTCTEEKSEGDVRELPQFSPVWPGGSEVQPPQCGPTASVPIPQAPPSPSPSAWLILCPQMTAKTWEETGGSHSKDRETSPGVPEEAGEPQPRRLRTGPELGASGPADITALEGEQSSPSSTAVLEHLELGANTLRPPVKGIIIVSEPGTGTALMNYTLLSPRKGSGVLGVVCSGKQGERHSAKPPF